MGKNFIIIAAYHLEEKQGKRGIGFKNGLPWPKISEDIIHFSELTTNTQDLEKINSVIMGRKTWDSLPDQFRPLPNRLNIIITKDPSKIPKNNKIIGVSSLNEALTHSYSSDIENHYVIGGGQIYKDAFKRLDCSKMYITHIDKEYKSDVFLPSIPYWMNLVNEDKIISKIGIPLCFQTYNNIIDTKSDENQYIQLIRDVCHGNIKHGRNGKVMQIFGPQHIFDLRIGFPILTTKRMFFNGIVKELIFFIKGETNANILNEQGVRIWNKNTTKVFLKTRNLKYKQGDMGPMYGFNWRHFNTSYEGYEKDYTDKGYDQLYHLIYSLVNDPCSRRHLLTTYDPSTVDQCVLAPCHGLIIQFNVTNNVLDCKMYQRSVDVALGYPFNIASYALLVHLICHVTGYNPGKLIMTLGDTHIYDQHTEKIKKHLDRIPLRKPTLKITKEFNPGNATIDDRIKFLENITIDDIKLTDYHHWPGIKMEMIA